MKDTIVYILKKLLGINDLSLYVRKKKQQFEKIIYTQKYTSDDIIKILRESGVKPGRPLVVHSAMGSLYNYKGTAEELIDKIIEYLGPDGTLCMPAYPINKFDNTKVFDVLNTPSAAGYLTEVFRKRPGVKRSLNQLHSVCALGKDADFITREHHLSRTCFDEHSPYYLIGQLGGYSMSIGMPKWFVGTGEHVCESLLYGKLPFFTNKFNIEETFHYIDEAGEDFYHTMNARSKTPKAYVRTHSTLLFDKFFDSQKFSRRKLSNIWICCFDMRYLYEKLTELAIKGINIYS